MAGAVVQNSPVDGSLLAFARSWDHLADELRCLDLRLHREMLRQPHQLTGDLLSAFKGLVISDAEAAELLTRPADHIAANGHDAAEDAEQKLGQSIAELENDIQQRRSHSQQGGIYLALARLTELFVLTPVSYTHLRAHETVLDLVCRL